MKQYVLLILLISCRHKEPAESPNLVYGDMSTGKVIVNDSVPEILATADSDTYNLCIGKSSSGLSSHHAIIIGDFAADKEWPPLTIYYDRKFWYFETDAGKELLQYLDIESAKPHTKELILQMQKHIMRYHIENIRIIGKVRNEAVDI